VIYGDRLILHLLMKLESSLRHFSSLTSKFLLSLGFFYDAGEPLLSLLIL